MPGSIVFRPIEANLTHNTDIISKMNPYCSFLVGEKRINSQICKKGGKHPHWSDSVSVPVANESKIMVELMDKDKLTKDDHIGSFVIDLRELEAQGQSSRWYPLYYKNKPAGEILLEASFQGQSGLYGSGLGQTGLTGTQSTGLVGTGVAGAGLVGTGFSGSQSTGFVGQESTLNRGFVEEGTLGQSEFVQRDQALLTGPAVVQQETFVSQTPIVEQHAARTFVEQRQTVEPHTFIKEVDVVETRPVQQTIEVMEARKVLKEVQYTEAVPVMKTIETMDARVVTKEVEVIEPRVVTKTIQVVENVPVVKQVEVIESVPVMREVETFEPQTFTKQVEVTEQVPVMRTVTVTEPVHLKKQVEFVEPIITTQTITKEIRPEVIVNEEITTSVGPATYVGEIRELSQRFGQITLTEQERVRYLGMTEQQRLSLSDEERWRWHEARRVAGGSGYNYGTSGSQFVSGSQYGAQSGISGGQFVSGSQYGAQSGISGGQFNFSEEDRLRYSKMTEQDLLGLPEQERLRWNQFRQSSGFGGQNFSSNYSHQGLGGQEFVTGSGKLHGSKF